MKSRRVVITGLGGVTPLANSMKESWQKVIKGDSGIKPITRFDASQYATRIAGEVRNFDPALYFEAKEIKKVDYFTQYAIASAQEAFDDANFSNASYKPRMVGSILGVGIGGLSMLERNHESLLAGGPRKVSPFLIPGMITNLAPGQVAIRFGLKGVNYAIQSACTSSTHALGEAYRMIKDGLQDAVFSGGAEGAITPTGIGGFCALKAMSTRNDEPEKASRPFDKNRDGFIMGEGSVLLLLEELESALARNAKIYGEIVGYGFSCDAFHITAPSPDGEGAIACMEMAVKSASIEPSAIDYINAHGTSTPANDHSETAAIKKVFGEHAQNGLLVSSTKSATGHLLGAAGAIEAAFCVLALKNGVVPPTLNLDEPDAGADLDYVPHRAREKSLTYALSNSFGFGGTNASLVFKRWSE